MVQISVGCLYLSFSFLSPFFSLLFLSTSTSLSLSFSYSHPLSLLFLSLNLTPFSLSSSVIQHSLLTPGATCGLSRNFSSGVLNFFSLLRFRLRLRLLGLLLFLFSLSLGRRLVMGLFLVSFLLFFLHFPFFSSTSFPCSIEEKV